MQKFDGKKYSEEIIWDLKQKVASEDIYAKLVSILVGDNKASLMYSKMKKQAAEKIGFEMEIKKLPEKTAKSEIITLINKYNSDEKITGIMIQLPLPSALREDTKSIVDNILPQKDVDGIGKNSHFLSATASAVYKIIKLAEDKGYVTKKSTIAIVGADGVVGSRLLNFLKQNEYKTMALDIHNSLQFLKEADVVISATGQEGVIKAAYLKEGCVIIDVGAPSPEFSEECIKKAKFYTPVPGGVGPVTIASLMENLYDASKN